MANGTGRKSETIQGSEQQHSAKDNLKITLSWLMQVSRGKLTSEEGCKEHVERDVEWMLHRHQKH